MREGGQVSQAGWRHHLSPVIPFFMKNTRVSRLLVITGLAYLGLGPCASGEDQTCRQVVITVRHRACRIHKRRDLWSHSGGGAGWLLYRRDHLNFWLSLLCWLADWRLVAVWEGEKVVCPQFLCFWFVEQDVIRVDAQRVALSDTV